MVLGDPLQLRRALVRVLVEIGNGLEGGEVAVSLVEEDGRVRVRLEFDGRENQPLRGLREDALRGGVGRKSEPSLGLRVASRIISAHGGTIANGRTATGRRWTEVVLPAAPVGPRPENAGQQAAEELR
jgi:hypothetical protein